MGLTVWMDAVIMIYLGREGKERRVRNPGASIRYSASVWRMSGLKRDEQTELA